MEKYEKQKKYQSKVCVNPIKTAANAVILKANDLPQVKIKNLAQPKC